MRPLPLLGLLATLVFSSGAVLAQEAQEKEPRESDPQELPVTATVAVDDGETSVTGLFTLRFEFRPDEDLTLPYQVRVELVRGKASVLRLDHAPRPPTIQWRKGQVVRYEVPAPFPWDEDLEGCRELEVVLAFVNPKTRKLVPPKSPDGLLGRRAYVGTMNVPSRSDVSDASWLDDVLAAAAGLAKQGRRTDAWSALELGIRTAEEDEAKYTLRDAITKLGHFDARPLSLVEESIVKSRIAAERRRYLRKESGRMYDRGQLHGALRIIEAVGGKLEEAADEAVLGALSDVERTQKDVHDLVEKMLDRITKDERDVVDAEILRLGRTFSLLRRVEAWIGAGGHQKAFYVLRDLQVVATDQKLRDAAYDLFESTRKAYIASTPPDEMKLVEKALSHPVFDRTVAIPTHKFIYIGPGKMLDGIPNASRLRFDLAYVFLCDLFGRAPNPLGDRITVYFKELWQFGGGVGGGKTIDIGRASPDRKGYRVDTGLLYHELTHCIDDTRPTLSGHSEGLANLGAVYAHEALGQTSKSLLSFETNLKAFRKDYLDRDLAYWRIQKYGPSAGFFLHFVRAYSRTRTGHDWKPYRQFFREYRAAPVRDGREPYVARAIAYFLVRAFGAKAFDDLVRFRLPLTERDREAVKQEMEAFAEGDLGVVNAEDDLREFPGSPLPRDLVTRRMILLRRMGGNDDEVLRISREELGIVHDWRVIGPFKPDSASAGAQVFPPEYEIDFAKEYPGKSNICKWRRVTDPGPVSIDPIGWVRLKYAYMSHTAIYGLTHVSVPQDMDAVVHVRTDDDLRLFVNDELVEDFRNRGGNSSSDLWWRGPKAKVPDLMRLPVRLRKGRNKILLRVRNRGGGAGFVLAVAGPDGGPVEGLVTDSDPPQSPTSVTDEAPGKWLPIVRLDFRKTKTLTGKLVASVGKLKVKNKLMFGDATGKGVRWRAYTVRPGFEKDQPSNLFWLVGKHTRDRDHFRLVLDMERRNENAPKLVVTIMGDGGKDGLSGWNLIVHGKGKGRVQASLERYDHLVYQSPPLPFGEGESHRLEITYLDGRYSARLGDATLFDRVPLTPIPGRHGVGVATFGRAPKFHRVLYEIPRQKR